LAVPKVREAIPGTANANTEDLASNTEEHGSLKLEKLDVSDLKGDSKSVQEALKAADKGEPEKLAATLKTDVKARRANARIIADPLRQEAIFASIESNMSEMEFIYQKFMRKGVVFEGNLTIRILIDPAGRVKDARIVSEKSTIDNANFASEILQNVKKWRFREDPQANGDVPVSFPLRFVNKE
jgi:TonB family protein